MNHIGPVKTQWFNSGTGLVGVVLCFDIITKTHKAYIGVGSGESEVNDIADIMHYGAKISHEMAESMFGEIGGYEW